MTKPFPTSSYALFRDGKPLSCPMDDCPTHEEHPAIYATKWSAMVAVNKILGRKWNDPTEPKTDIEIRPIRVAGHEIYGLNLPSRGIVIRFLLVIFTLLFVFGLLQIKNAQGAEVAVSVSAEVPELYQAWASEHCVAGQRVCYSITPSTFEGKVNAEALDLGTSEFMRTIWLSPSVMGRNIWGPSGFSCVLMYENGLGELVEEDCETKKISVLVGR